MVICPKCDAENPKGRKFCSKCKTFLGQIPFSAVVLAWLMITAAYFYLLSILFTFLTLGIEPISVELGLKLCGAVYVVLAGGYLLRLKGWAWVLSFIGFLGALGFGGWKTVVFILNDFQPDWMEMIPDFLYDFIGIFGLTLLIVNIGLYFMNSEKEGKKFETKVSE